ncbi:unnamed protein product [Mytilus coruscus]|uniref:CCHC-type domain-containing protein n=1 Tax=Mytilus coruscus TaxID=42192 RepID=A0A6J8API0_MYTCO|nr:unnamed protein product [Mytilus coruscus]
MAKSNEQNEPKMASYAEKTKTDPKTIEPSDMVSVKPVFIQETDVFGSISDGETLKKLYLTHPEMYKAVGEVVPERTIIGLQRIRGLWRIYLDDESERDILISKCLKIRGKSIWICSRNPRVTAHENINNVRIRVKDVPLSADDGQIIREMEKYGCSILSNMRERLRYNNKVTNCLTGDRIIICDGPLTEHIPRSILIGKYRATIIYRDQPRNNPQYMKCSKCLQEGHQTKDCINDWVCRSCGQEGHKQNACTKDTFSDAPDQSDNENNKESHETSDADDETSESETGTDATQISVKTNNAEICESASATGREGASAAECEGVSTTGCEDDNGQSQSIINPVADPRKRKKKKKKRTSTQESTKKSQTPSKQPVNITFLKSPVTPTEKLHDKESDSTAKRSKTTDT